MLKQAHKQPQMTISVTKEEYEQFLAEETFLPHCIQLNSDGLPNCEEDCPEALVCAMFTYHDAEHGIDVEWYACAPPSVLEQLSTRAVDPVDNQKERKVKYVAYESDC